MKTYELKATLNPKLWRVVDRKGDWNRYFFGDVKDGEPQEGGKWLKSVNHILDSGYAKGVGFYEYLKRATKDEVEKKLREAGERGDAIHQAISNVFRYQDHTMQRTDPVVDDTGIERPLTDDEWDALISFHHFCAEHDPKIIVSEFPTYNILVGYAGTLDAILVLRKACKVRFCKCDSLVGKVGLFDWKSGGGIYDSYGPQVEAYSAGENIPVQPVYTAILRLGTKHKTTNGYEFVAYVGEERIKHMQEFFAAKTISDAGGTEWEPTKEIVEIPSTLAFSSLEVSPVEKTPEKAVAGQESGKRGVIK